MRKFKLINRVQDFLYTTKLLTRAALMICKSEEFALVTSDKETTKYMWSAKSAERASNLFSDGAYMVDCDNA